MNYIFDTSPAILLYEKCTLGKQLLEFSKTNKLYVPSRVLEEYAKGENVKPSDITDFKKVFSSVNPVLNRDLLPYFNFKDSSGEIWVVSHALKNPECCCVIDEEFGRNIAFFFGIKLTGSIGIIEEMKNQKLLSVDELRQLWSKVRESGFYLSEELLEKLKGICS